MIYTNRLSFSRGAPDYEEFWDLTEHLEAADVEEAAQLLEAWHHQEGPDCRIEATFTDGSAREVHIEVSTFRGLTSCDIEDSADQQEKSS